MSLLSGPSRCAARLLTTPLAFTILGACSPPASEDPDPPEVHFSRITASPAVNDRASTGSGQWIDVTGNGHLDLFVSNGYDVSSTPVPQLDRLYLNDGTGRLVRADGGDLTRDSTFSSGATWGDFDNDGLPDVFIPAQRDQHNRLYRNLGDGTFERVLDTPLTAEDAAHRGASWGDCTGDGHPDLFIARGWSPGIVTSALYRNDGDWRFTLLAESAASTDTINAMAAAWGDYNNDGNLDLIVSGRGVMHLYRNEGACRLVRVTEGGSHLLDGGETSGIYWVDYNNDGLLDIFAANGGSAPVLYTNLGGGRFQRLDHGDLGRFVTFGGGASWGDFNGDGYLDLYLANWPNWPGANEENHLYRNEGGTGNHWLGVELVGTSSNRSAVGARIRLRAHIRGEEVWQLREVHTHTGFRSQGPFRQHFGLGDATRVEGIEVRWPSGLLERFPGTAVNRMIVLTEGEGQPPPG